MTGKIMFKVIIDNDLSAQLKYMIFHIIQLYVVNDESLTQPLDLDNH